MSSEGDVVRIRMILIDDLMLDRFAEKFHPLQSLRTLLGWINQFG